jgi:hypothetical protein
MSATYFGSSHRLGSAWPMNEPVRLGSTCTFAPNNSAGSAQLSRSRAEPSRAVAHPYWCLFQSRNDILRTRFVHHDKRGYSSHQRWCCHGRRLAIPNRAVEFGLLCLSATRHMRCRGMEWMAHGRHKHCGILHIGLSVCHANYAIDKQRAKGV